MTLEQKLLLFDQRINEVLDELELMLRHDRDTIILIARARHATGHMLYGDSELYEFPDGLLRTEAVKELADAAIYTHVLRSRAG